MYSILFVCLCLCIFFQSLYDPARNVFFVVWIAEDSNKNQLQYFSAMNASSGSMLQTKLTDVGFGDRIQQISLDAVSGDVFAIRGPIGVNNMTLNRIYQGSSIVNEWILSFPYQWTVSVLAQGNGFVANGTLIALMQEGNYGVLASIDLQSWHINYWTVPVTWEKKTAICFCLSALCRIGFQIVAWALMVLLLECFVQQVVAISKRLFVALLVVILNFFELCLRTLVVHSLVALQVYVLVLVSCLYYIIFIFCSRALITGQTLLSAHRRRTCGVTRSWMEVLWLL